MSKIHIANLVTIRHWIVSDDEEKDQGDWITVNRFQNARPDKPVSYDGKEYSFLPFIYNGATRSRTGDNIEASLAVSTNRISMDHAYDIVMIDFNKTQHHIKRQVVVRTCLMSDGFTKVQKVLSKESWIGASMGYTEDVVEILLASAVDAVFAGFPNQHLDEKVVGRLPTTARVSTI